MKTCQSNENADALSRFKINHIKDCISFEFQAKLTPSNVLPPNRTDTDANYTNSLNETENSSDELHLEHANEEQT